MIYRASIYLLFFLSGLSALIYQVLWVRSFSLIFGGSHLAVTTVLSVFMGGLALGGLLGKHADRCRRPLRLYGLLEIGIGVAALLLLWLLGLYPDLYVAFARLVDDQPALLMCGRLIFAVFALLLPTTLMGLTLPVLAGFGAMQKGSLGAHLSLLYGINTFGAVAGALAAGFFLLGHLTVPATYGLAIAFSVLGGLISLLLDHRFNAVNPRIQPDPAEEQPLEKFTGIQNDRYRIGYYRLILLGIGISGFCALGYEVLWTRVLSIVVGTTVYSYTLMLVAFLVGIALGGASYRFLLQRFRKKLTVPKAVLCFGLIQIVIGLLAILVSYALRDLPLQTVHIETWLKGWLGADANLRHLTNFSMAVIYMLIPAFFMGLAFPLAGDIVARSQGEIGRAVGRTLTCNTLGAILGAAVSGFLLVRLFGIERSLQFLALINLGLGLTVCARLMKARLAPWAAASTVAGLMLLLCLQPGLLTFWDMKYFAVFSNNARTQFAVPEKRADILRSSDVLYYAEGTTSTISVVKFRGGNQGIHVNGKTVASTAPKDRQCQYTLGHLPMLLHRNPQKVWVLGMGTGMTAGATAIHPEVESVTIVELEKHVPAAADTFAEWNHDLLNNPKVEVVFNDGRNFLLTTEERYDVITADPIHPWSQGAAYLYTDEYYRLAASRLRPGGVMCQWLPIYELTPRDLQSVVKTFSNNFRYVYIWQTDYDAELIGSNDPLDIDLEVLQQRLEASPEVLSDLQQVDMGSAAALVSYFIMGPKASQNYGKDAPLNTDNNLYLEFSAPRSVEKPELIAANIASLASHREDISPYLGAGSLAEALATDAVALGDAARLYDQAHQLHYQGQVNSPLYGRMMGALENRYPWYAPGQFLRKDYQVTLARVPQPLDQQVLALVNAAGTPVRVTLSTIRMNINPEHVRLLVVDNHIRKIYGSVYVEGPQDNLERRVDQARDQLQQLITTVYRQQQTVGEFPGHDSTLASIERAIGLIKTEDI